MKLSAMTPVADPAPQTEILADIAVLQSDGPFASAGKLDAYLAPAGKIPAIMHEIGRLREEVFRSVGEGSGKALDLDRFDETYLHLFLWDREAQRVAGAYRLGRTDHLLENFGPAGLYTSTLYEFEQPFLDHLNPGLELGRSFVAKEYQKSIHPLSLLWKGIGRFVAKYPRYAKLFGPVSISDDYTRISKDMIVKYLKKTTLYKAVSRFVRPLFPYDELPDSEDVSPLLTSIESVSARIAETEPDGKGVPVLLRQYLRLNATLLEFNVDPDFAGCLDALVLVDLREAPAAAARRYMGAEGYEAMMGMTINT